MPPFELTHPPPSRPVVVDESVKDMELVCDVLKTDQVNTDGIKDKFGAAGPVPERWIALCTRNTPVRNICIQVIDAIV